jgi:hypothetical protein
MDAAISLGYRRPARHPGVGAVHLDRLLVQAWRRRDLPSIATAAWNTLPSSTMSTARSTV